MSIQIHGTDLNFLIYCYLQENGLTHSAFTLSQEAMINEESYRKKSVMPGALLSIVEKGLMLKYIESHLEQAVNISKKEIQNKEQGE